MIYLLAFAVVTLAVARATRVIVFDDIAQPLRAWILRRWPLPSAPGKLVTCYWCAAVWISLLGCLFVHTVTCAAGWLPWHTFALLPVNWFAVAYASAWVLDKEGTADGV